MTIPRNKLGFAQSLRTKLRYTTRKEFDVSAIESVAYESIRANGIVDPEVSLGGHQPRGFDQAKALYGAFTVLSSKISVNWAYAGYDGPAALDSTLSDYLIKTNKVETDAGAVAACPPVMCGIYKGIDALANPSSAAQVMEHDRTVWKPMNSQQSGIITSAKANIGAFYGYPNLVQGEGYSGTTDPEVDPTEQVHYTVWAGRTNGTSAGVCHLTAYITVTYDVVFTEPKVLQAS